MADRGQRVNGSAEGLETLRNRSSMRKLLYDNLWCTARLGRGAARTLFRQLADAQPELTERQKTLFLAGGRSESQHLENAEKIEFGPTLKP